jgi:hypothetical protein
MWPDAPALRLFLARVSRRLVWLAAAQGAAAGLLIAFIVFVAGWPRRGEMIPSAFAGVVLAAIGAAVQMAATADGRRKAAYLVERRAPQCRNALIAAGELIDARGSPPAAAIAPLDEYVGEIVCRDAARQVRTLDLRALFPARNSVLTLGAIAALWVIALLRPPVQFAMLRTAGAAGAAISRIDVIVTPPAYAGLPVQKLRDPARIQTLAGSRVLVTVHSNAAAITLETLRGREPLASSGNDTFTAELLADADGYIAFEPATAAGPGYATGVRRLIGLSVTADNAPHVRISAPAKDLFLRDADHTIDLAIEADDDIGLASLRLRYTKVSGSGERYTFTEGELPLQVTRLSNVKWTAHASWHLSQLGLEPGDMVVYRAVAADHRPGASPSESDAYIAELLAPGGEAAPGFELDPDQERYAVSQQMIILKSERLLARKATTTADAYAADAQDIGAEQRKVRAEFVFMMGGEIADAPLPEESMTDLDETAETEGEQDLLAGRMANQGRIALLRAIRSMSRATTSLTSVDVTLALTHERAALKQLLLAFSHTRIILRALTEHERLDLSRRRTGALLDVSREGQPNVEPEPDPRVKALRRHLSGIAALAAGGRFGAGASAQASALAEQLLQTDASSKPLQQVASQLTGAAADIGHGRSDEAYDLLDRAATGLAAVIRADLLKAPESGPGIATGALAGALTDALRHPAP